MVFKQESDWMNDELYTELLQTSWRRKLSAEEEAQLRAWLAAHPEVQTDWEEEALLTQQLERLPNTPLASNFTAQVMQELDRELAREEREGRGWRMPRWWRRIVPRLASALLLAGLAVTGLVQYQKYQFTQMTDSVKRLTPVASVLQPEIMQDFDAIQQLRHVPSVSDEELLAALQ
jgi:anti-sigma factor RsiW